MIAQSNCKAVRRRLDSYLVPYWPNYSSVPKRLQFSQPVKYNQEHLIITQSARMPAVD